MRTKIYNWERICARFPINNDRLLLFTSRNPSFGAAQQLRCELTELCWGAYRRVYRGEVCAENWLLKLCYVSENEKKSKLSLQSSSWILQSLFVMSHTKVNALCLQARVTSLWTCFTARATVSKWAWRQQIQVDANLKWRSSLEKHSSTQVLSETELIWWEGECMEM